MLSELSKLAEVNSSEKRRELMNGIAELFVKNNEHVGLTEINLFGEILTKLLNIMDDGGKTRLSEEFSTLPNTPRTFAVAIANESADIARPMLAKSVSLTDSDLVEISQHSDEQHRLAISSRQNVSSEVTDSLIHFGEDEVLRCISANEGAELSDNGLRKMVEHSLDDSKLLTNIINRDSLFDQLRKVLPTLSNTTQLQLSGLLSENNPQKLNLLMQTANKQMAKDRLDKKTDQIEAKKAAKSIADGKMDKDEAITIFAQKNKPLKIATLFSKFANLDEKYVANSLLQLNSDALAVLCKSIGIRAETVKEIGEMRCRILKTPSSSVVKLVDNFNDLSGEISQRTMRFIKLQTSLSKTSA